MENQTPRLGYRGRSAIQESPQQENHGFARQRQSDPPSIAFRSNFNRSVSDNCISVYRFKRSGNVHNCNHVQCCRSSCWIGPYRIFITDGVFHSADTRRWRTMAQPSSMLQSGRNWLNGNTSGRDVDLNPPAYDVMLATTTKTTNTKTDWTIAKGFCQRYSDVTLWSRARGIP